MREAEQRRRIEAVGSRLRAIMPFLDAVTIAQPAEERVEQPVWIPRPV